jgi:hypothetical protein
MKTRFGFGHLALAAAAMIAVPLQTAPAQQATMPARAAHPSVVPATAAAAQSAPKTSREPAKAGAEGLKIHGHWKFEVRNPDGKLVKTVEFENSLVTPGQADIVLSEIFAGQFAIAGFSVFALPSNGTTLCPDGIGYAGCGMIPNTANSVISVNQCAYAVCTQNLTQTYVPYNSSTSTAGYFQLQGTFSPTVAGTVTTVKTFLAGCENSTGAISTVTNQQCGTFSLTSPSETGVPAGTTYGEYNFTSATLPTPLALVAGQVVTVTVTISFS